MKLNLQQFEAQVFFTSVRITSERDKSKGSSVGTGFLYRLDLDNNRSVILLISNKHVLQDSKTINLVFNRRQKTQNAPKLGEIVAYTIANPGENYITHPKKGVDLACMNISDIATQKTNKAFFKNLHKDMLSNLTEDGLHAGATVWFVGYPENRFDVKNNLPILRSGTIASMPSVDFNGEKQFIIDAQVFPGSSGSPVFVVIGNQYRFIGVISQTMIRNQQLQVLPTLASVGIEQVLGLGIVIKASELNALFTEVLKKFKEGASKSSVEKEK